MKFVENMNSVTSKKLNAVKEAVRRELEAGMITGGNTIAELTKRMSAVFENATKYRAKSIAITESSRAIHDAQILAADSTGLVSGFKYLLSTDACPICVEVEKSHPKTTMKEARGQIGSYDSRTFPPVHPSCMCTIEEIIIKEKP